MRHYDILGHLFRNPVANDDDVGDRIEDEAVMFIVVAHMSKLNVISSSLIVGERWPSLS